MYPENIAARFGALSLAMIVVLIAGCPQQERKQLADLEPPDQVAADSEKPETAVEPSPPISKLDQLLRDLRSDKQGVHDAARREFEVILPLIGDALTTAEGEKLLRAAAEKYPSFDSGSDDFTATLVATVARRPRQEYVPVVVELYGKLNDDAKWWASVLLAGLETREAAVATIDIVRTHAPAGKVPALATGPLAENPRHGDVFFPELLKYATAEQLTLDVYRLCLVYCNAGLVSPETLAPFADQTLKDYRALAEKLRPAQSSEGVAWMWDETYGRSRYDAAMLLDLLGHFPPEPVEAELQEALKYSDPRLQYFAIFSLLRQGKTVDAKHFERVAGRSETRGWLYEELSKLEKPSLMPEKFATQAALAESDLVAWLLHPNELGRVPDEIEMMKAVGVEMGEPTRTHDYYVFRFRVSEPHRPAIEGWMAGVSGPFVHGDLPAISSLGDTFSAFEPWEGKTPEQHVDAVRQIMERLRGQRAP